jgi:gamma-glutamyl-gamma-aminobutyrate hydrolase PuuD
MEVDGHAGRECHGARRPCPGTPWDDIRLVGAEHGPVTVPLVAIPGYRLATGGVAPWASGGFGLPEPYVAALCRAGIQPVILPAVPTGDPDRLLARFSGLLLAGGGDVDPRRYGAEPHPAVYGVDAGRDELELALVRAALVAHVPVLAICRGLQVVNVACGGTLWQHLPELEGWDVHGDPTATRSTRHDVEAKPGSRLADALGCHRLEECVSHHHQGVAELGEGLVAVGWSADGLVEALEPAGEGWLVAVQWHPEVTAGAIPTQQRLFDAFAGQVRRSSGVEQPPAGRHPTDWESRH